MKTIPLEDDRWRVFLDTSEYRALLESTYENGQNSVRQIRLEMRLMACSLRVDTVSELRYKQFHKRETPEGDRWVVKVEAKDSTDREAETRPRAVYVPNDIMEDVHAFADRHRLDPDDKLFQCSTRTIQRDVTRSAANAATRTGNQEFLKVSAHDLRRYFATHLLFRHQVDTPVVRVLGGWKSDESMFEYLVLPDDVLFERLGDAGLLGTSYDKLERRNHSEKIEATADRLQDLLDDADRETVEAVADGRLGDVIESIDEITTDAPTESTRPAGSENQRSFDAFFRDEEGALAPDTAAKAAYVAALVAGSWSVTLAPLV